jgi:hypothetical protein
VIAEGAQVIVAIEVASKEERVLKQVLSMTNVAENFSLKRVQSFLPQWMSETT